MVKNNTSESVMFDFGCQKTGRHGAKVFSTHMLNVLKDIKHKLKTATGEGELWTKTMRVG